MESLGRFLGLPLIEDLVDTVDSVGDDPTLLLVSVDRLDGGGYGLDEADYVGEGDQARHGGSGMGGGLASLGGVLL